MVLNSDYYPGYPNSDEELVKNLRNNGVDIKAEKSSRNTLVDNIILFFITNAFTYWGLVLHHATITRWWKPCDEFW